MAGNFFRGTNVDQDCRWGKADERLMAKMQQAGKFAPILSQHVDIQKVNIEVIAKWCSERLTEILGFEDDIVNGLIVNMLNSKVRYMCIFRRHHREN
jgi:serine/arginine repetitive matrix protein 1